MNQYVTELPKLLDIKFFQRIAKDLITEEWLSLSDPQALGKFTDRYPVAVSDHKYLTLVKDLYPNLSSEVKFMKSTRGTWPTHFDNHRQTAINIPIANSQNTVTRFYTGGKAVTSVTEEFGGEPGTWYSNDYLTYVKDATPDFDHVLMMPTIVNTTIPHSIINNGNEPRVICSWAYNGTYEEALEDFGV